MTKETAVEDPHTETLTIENPHVAGFCALPKYELTVAPRKLLTGRVALDISGSATEIRRALADLADNTPVGSKDLIDSIMKMRTLIFTTKAGVR